MELPKTKSLQETFIVDMIDEYYYWLLHIVCCCRFFESADIDTIDLIFYNVSIKGTQTLLFECYYKEEK
jgi:hypothetical protein